MLPTFVIGLREGLEAALIVSIIATFLRRNGAGLRGMWLGVGLGVLLSIAVGVVLRVVEQNLPQAQQEGMETVIGLVAVCFVTGMIVWMRTHARFLKRDLEHHASAALKTGTTTALVLMAFLAVLREGFETSVFLLATFQNATSAPAAMAGALLGVLVAVLLGWGIYRGGVRLNLQRFFSGTGLFLVLVAAGLVLSAFRSAHEAGWVMVGQQHTVDLTWLSPPGSVRSALVSGVLGIPHDPRAIEVLAWACYLIPLLLLTFWPARHRPRPELAARLMLAGAAVAATTAALLVVLVPLPAAHIPATAPVAGGGTASVHVQGKDATLTHAGRVYRLSPSGTDRWTSTKASGALPSRLGVDRLLAYTADRVPVGLNIHAAPGPYDARWRDSTRLTVLMHEGGLVDAHVNGRLLLTISGGGLTSPRVTTVSASQWRLSPAYVQDTQRRVLDAAADRRDRELWKYWLPAFLLSAAIGFLWTGLRRRAALQPTRNDSSSTTTEPTGHHASPSSEGTSEHARTTA